MNARPDPIAVAVAKAALCEVGRPDLAAQVRANRADWPSSRHSDDDVPVIVKAFHLGHVAAGHRDARIIDNGIHCDDCLESYR